MGLIRKSLALGTLGVVRPSSRKQRVAKATLNELKAQTRLMQPEKPVTPHYVTPEQEAAGQRALEISRALQAANKARAADRAAKRLR